MAPPKSRRPGFSRRAQYGMFLGYVVAVGGVFVAGLLLLVAYLNPPGFGAVRGIALDITSPISASGRGAVRTVTSGASAVADYFVAARRNEELRQQIRSMRQRMLQARAVELENQRLKMLLGLREELTDEVAVARIVSSSFDTSRRLATLSAGSSSGVRVGQPVRAPEGLVGRVIETGRWAARVLLVTDGASNVPVQLLRSGLPAMATGRGDGTIDIKPLEVGKNPFRRGDIFITSGVGGIYSPGIPVAMVVKVDKDTTIARPIADPARVDRAIVQHVFQPAANQPLSAAEPPAPNVPAPAEAIQEEE